jgi:hypothetical protein
MEPVPEAYYIRPPGGRVQGPFPVGKIRDYIAAGRVRPDMEFSSDGVEWQQGETLPALFTAPPGPPGSELQPAPRARRTRASRRHASPSGLEDPETRGEINHAIASAHRSLLALRGLFIADAVLVALVLLMGLAGESTWFPLVTGGLLAVVVLCAVFVKRNPLACTITMAVFHTVFVIPILLGGIFGAPRAICLLALCVAWATVWMAWSLGVLLARYPQALAAKRFRGERLTSGEAGTKWQDRMQKDRSASRKRLALFVGLPLVMAIGALVVFSDPGSDGGDPAQGPPTPEMPLQPRLDAYRQAWNEGGMDDVTVFFAADLAPRKSQLLAKLLRRRSWSDERPSITFERRKSAVPHQVAIFWTMHDYDRVMQTDWQWEAGGWWLLDLKLRIRK